jgi:predicted alpha/beta-fold hydrolase
VNISGEKGFAMSDDINHPRRRLLGTAAMTLAAAQLGLTPLAHARCGEVIAGHVPAIQAGTVTSFDSPQQIAAGVLNVGYAEAGPAEGPVVILLHGWPYDIHSFVEVAPVLASKGYRVIVPHLRGYGTTRFLSGETARNGQQSVIAVDIIALMDEVDHDRWACLDVAGT